MPQTPKPSSPAAPTTIGDAITVLQSEGWKNLGFYTGSCLFIRRRNPVDLHETPVEFWLSDSTLADVSQLPTRAEFQQAAPDAEQRNG